MSRRSSISSGSVSTSAKSGIEDDPLMRDCYDLRRRLLQTEQSLQNMKPPSFPPSEKSRATPRVQLTYDRKRDSTDRERNYQLSPDEIRYVKTQSQSANNPGTSSEISKQSRIKSLAREIGEQRGRQQVVDHNGLSRPMPLSELLCGRRKKDADRVDRRSPVDLVSVIRQHQLLKSSQTIAEEDEQSSPDLRTKALDKDRQMEHIPQMNRQSKQIYWNDQISYINEHKSEMRNSSDNQLSLQLDDLKIELGPQSPGRGNSSPFTPPRTKLQLYEYRKQLETPQHKTPQPNVNFLRQDRAQGQREHDKALLADNNLNIRQQITSPCTLLNQREVARPKTYWMSADNLGQLAVGKQRSRWTDNPDMPAAWQLNNRKIEILGPIGEGKLSPPDFSLNGPRRSYSSSPESAQVLTLADLTPPASEPIMATHARKGTPSLGPSQPFRSSLPDLRNGSTHSSPRDRELDNRSFGSGSDYDHDTLRRKLGRQREENSQLVNQNHKLMSELENMSYELHQSKNKIKIVSRDLEEERKRFPSLEDRIVTLESQLAEQEDHAGMSHRQLAECQDELQSKTEELRSVLESSNIAEAELREEARLRKRAEAQLEDALRSVEELSEKLADQDSSLKTIRKQHTEKEKHLRDGLSHSQKESEEAHNKISSMEPQIYDLKQEIRLLQQEGIAREDTHTSMHQENASLRATISRQSQKIGRLENELRKNEVYFKDSNDQHGVIDRQREKILQYQQEIEETKIHMTRLEDLVHRVQEQSMKEHVNTTPSQTSDSGICSSTQTVNGFRTSSPGSNGSYLNGDISVEGELHTPASGSRVRAVIADLKLKLALKDAEIQKLQASAVARAAAQQKHIAGLAGDGGTMDGLRSELSAIVERSRMGDRKQHELEHMITRLEDEIVRCSSQNIQLEERLADKMSQIASLEGRLGHRNLRVVDLQKDLEDKVSETNELLREVRQKSSQAAQLERQLEEKSSEYGEHALQLREFKEEIQSKGHQIDDLKGALEAKDTELKDSVTFVEKVKSLHGEHCKELELQIEQFQKKFEEKNVMVIQLETALAGTRQELELRSSIAEQMERNLEENKHELVKSETQAIHHNQKFEDLHSQAEHATKQMKHLEKSLADCQNEINVYIGQLEETRREHESEIRQAREEISKLERALQQATVDLQQKAGYIGKLEQALSDRQAALQKEQGRCREMQESRVHLQQQVSLIEEEISRERNTTQIESNQLQQKLQEAKTDLEQRTKEINELSSTLRDMHKDMKQSSASIVELEQLLQLSRSQNDKNVAQLQTVDKSNKEARAHLSQQTKKNGELEERLRQTENELNGKTDQIGKLDNELTRLQGDSQDTISQLKSLEDLLASSKRVMEEKEKKVNELDKMLNESVEELQHKDKDLKTKESQIADMDQALKDSKKELKNKDAQVSQLDMTMKEHRNGLQQKTMAIEHSLNQSRYELSERAVEVAELKAKLDQAQDLLRQKKTRLDHYEKTAKQQQQDIKKRMTQVSELEREAEKLRRRRQDSEETSQELRLSREQLQNAHGELMEGRRELLKYQRREQELIQELDDAHTLLTAKEGDCTRLAKDLGAAQVREAQAEARCVQEMRKAQQQNELRQVTQDNELQRLQESHHTLIAKKEELEAEKRIVLNNMQDNERQLTQELSRNHEETSAFAEENNRLASQLSVYQEDAKRMNETLVIKDAEIARLEARISGYERAVFGKHQFDGLDLGFARSSSRAPMSPRAAHVRRVTSPRPLTDSSHSGLTKSISDHNLHNLSDSYPFSVLETDDLLDYNHNNRVPTIRVNEGLVPYSSRSRNTNHAMPSGHHKESRSWGSESYNGTSGMERLEGLLIQANQALDTDKDPLLLTPASAAERSQTHSDGMSNMSPPQRELPDTGSEDSRHATLSDQLEAKKAAAGLTGTPLDPSKCRASLEERLRVSEQRRKQIDKQLYTMQSTVS